MNKELLNATHYCTECHARWRSTGNHWHLVSERCGPCCDNAAMSEQIEPIAYRELQMEKKIKKVFEVLEDTRYCEIPEVLSLWQRILQALDDNETPIETAGLERPRHGFDRDGSHSEDRYVCDCGYDDCGQADAEWMDWAEKRIEQLQTTPGYNSQDSIVEDLKESFETSGMCEIEVNDLAYLFNKIRALETVVKQISQICEHWAAKAEPVHSSFDSGWESATAVHVGQIRRQLDTLKKKFN